MNLILYTSCITTSYIVVQNTIKAADIFHAISDQGALQIFNFIATEKKKKINSQTLQSLNGLTKKQYYSRMHELTKFGLVKRTLGIYQLTSFGKIVYSSKLKINAAFKNYWQLKALDSLEVTNEINAEARKALVKELVKDNVIKNILLCEH
jgi:predicted transcriptional regulator